MALSKKGAAGIMIIILIVGLGMFMFAPTDSPEDPQVPNDENPNNSDTDDQIDNDNSDIDFPGFVTDSNGRVNVIASVIADNHRSALLNSSADVSYDQPGVQSNVKKIGNRIIQTENRSFGHVRKYSDGVITYAVNEYDGQNEYDAEQGAISASSYHQHSFHNAILTDLDVEDVSQDEDGINVTLSSSTDLDNLDTVLSDVQNINEAEAKLRISNDGIIRSVELDVLGQSLIGTPRSETYKYTVNQVTGVEVSEPAWVRTASERTAIIKSTSVPENNWIRLDHEGLAEIPSGSMLRIIATSGDTDTIELSRSVSSGDSIYIAPQEADDWRMYINEEPLDPGQVDFTEGSEVIVDIVNEDSDGGQITYYSETIVLQS